MTATVIAVGNKVGGAGKSTTTTALSYVLAEKQGNKVLVIDSEGQRDSGKLIEKTYPEFKNPVEGTLMNAYGLGDIEPYINQVTDNLYLVRSDKSIEAVNANGYKYGGKDVNSMLSRMLEPLRNEFDYIIIDLPPASTSVLCNNGIFAAEFVLVPIQSAPKDIENTYDFLAMLQGLRKDYGIRANLLGVLPWLQSQSGKDRRLIKLLRRDLPGAVYENAVDNRRRIKYFFDTGLTLDELDPWNADWVKIYTKVANETIQRITALRGEK